MPDQLSDASVAVLIHRLLSGSWLVEGQTPWEISAAQAELLEQLENEDGPLLVIEQQLLPFISSVTSSKMGLVECLRITEPERSERCQLATLRRAVNALEQSVTERLRELREGAAAEQVIAGRAFVTAAAPLPKRHSTQIFHRLSQLSERGLC